MRRKRQPKPILRRIEIRVGRKTRIMREKITLRQAVKETGQGDLFSGLGAKWSLRRRAGPVSILIVWEVVDVAALFASYGQPVEVFDVALHPELVKGGPLL
jgi:hypothetical protein